MFQSIAMPNFFYVYRCTEPPLLILNVEQVYIEEIEYKGAA